MTWQPFRSAARSLRSESQLSSDARRIGPLKAIKLGDGGSVARGQFVLSIANPYAAGFRDGQPSASWGIISNLRQLCTGGDFIAAMVFQFASTNLVFELGIVLIVLVVVVVLFDR